MDSRIKEARTLADGLPQIVGDIVRRACDAYDERLKVNVGLVSENAGLRKAVHQPEKGLDLSGVPIVELLQEIQRRAGE